MSLSVENSKELNHILTRISIALLIYVLLQSNFPNSKIPLTLMTIMSMSIFYNTGIYKFFKSRVFGSISRVDIVSRSEEELLKSLKSLNSYESKTRNWNNNKKKNFRQLSTRQQRLVFKTGYLDKIDKVDKCIEKNNELIKDLVKFSMINHNISLKKFYSSSINIPNENYKVIECLCHYTRDWSNLGDVEIKPIILYIQKILEKILTVEQRSKTCVIVPGSGLGRISHEIAIMGGKDNINKNFKMVNSIEFSSLMFLFNEFVYSNLNNNFKNNYKPKKYQLFPYIHTYSNHLTTENQIRSIEFNQLSSKPLNLKISNENFNNFILKNDDEYDNIVIVTVFFMDTAENIIDYLDTMDKIVSPIKGKKIWINIGPLKYGTAPKVELNLQEIQDLRKSYGWECIDESLKPELLGYLTDLKGMWQGQYGVSMFACEMKK
ncbi:hypothetical protein PACTADRAFT_2950 [Pachysolen tannophilus NRRL Y-2460]|uniref:Uncharacterized protein n=1 Tax=Pachysolen tannophilus NRRL Y-2460 TaxID=669874 RepID=A0A1E4TU17_PACTA|nr:hypothetical protein PACTADRAFT_2950 [Pachysolen tannophilus NRRL Y-2460]